MSGYNCKDGTWWLHQSVCPCLSTVPCLQLATTPLSARNPESYPSKVRLPPTTKIHVPLEHLFSACPSRVLQPRRQVVSVSVIPTHATWCLLLSPAMRSNAGMAIEAEGRLQLALWLLVSAFVFDCLTSEDGTHIVLQRKTRNIPE